MRAAVERNVPGVRNLRWVNRVPKSTPKPPNYALSFDNLLASCDGSERTNPAPPVRPAERLHCDARKRAQQPLGRILDPSRQVPDRPLLWDVDPETGRISAHEAAFEAAGLPPALGPSTIEALGLHAPAPTRGRLAALHALDAELADTTDDERHAIGSAHLEPDPHGALTPYWTTVRWWAGAP